MTDSNEALKTFLSTNLFFDIIIDDIRKGTNLTKQNSKKKDLNSKENPFSIQYLDLWKVCMVRELEKRGE